MADDAWAKDCLCLDGIHVGPCWLHSDALWCIRNIRLLEERDDDLALLAFAQEEVARLAEKVYQMRRRRLDVVPPEWRRPDLDERQRQALLKFA